VLFLLVAPGVALAGDIPVLKARGVVAKRADPGVGSRDPAAARAAYPKERRPVRTFAATAAAKRRTVAGELRRMLDAGAIDETTYRERRDVYDAAKAMAKRLPAGRRKIEMAGVVGLVDAIAARGALTVSRLEPLFQTLERNRQWWSTGPLLASGQRVGFDDSELVWQYVPGEGLAIHPLANFGKLNGLWKATSNTRLGMLLDELLALPADRSGTLAWEYYFDFGGGRPPWVSGLAQGTALQSIARAAVRLQRTEEIWPLTKRALALFRLPAPEGVRVDANGGAHYLIYSFSPDLRVLNGFIQALIGLNDYAALANDDEARQLFADGDRSARVEVPQYDTSAWSLYSRGAVVHESSLSYHELLTGFLENLCTRTSEPVYCETGQRFTDYLTLDPQIKLVTQRLRGGKPGAVRFDLSKISRVGIRVARGSTVVLSRAEVMGYGRRSFTWAVPRKAGDYDVRLTAVDLAGNVSESYGALEVLEPRKKKRRT
jgi:hypothetical protein